MDVQTIDQQYAQLQGQSQQTAQALQTLGAKLQTAAQAGDQQAREWLLDLRELALAFRSEQDQVANLLQALHAFVANAAQVQNQAIAAPQQQAAWGQAPGYQPQPSYAPQSGFAQPSQGYAPPQQGGGMLGGFLNSGFGRAIEMGAGFGLGEDLLSKIF